MTNKWRIDWQTGSAYLWYESVQGYVFFCKFEASDFSDENELIDMLEERLEYNTYE